jgi:hypothetical protein
MVGLGKSRKSAMGNEHLLTNAARLQLATRYQVVKGTDRDTQHLRGGFSIIQ